MTTTEALTRAQALLTECLDHLGIADPEATEIKMAVELSLRIERFKEICRVYDVGRLELPSPPEPLTPGDLLRIITPVTVDDHYDCVLEAGLQAQLALGERDLSRKLLEGEVALNTEAAGTRGKGSQVAALRRYQKAYAGWEEADAIYRSVVADYEQALSQETDSRQSVA